MTAPLSGVDEITLGWLITGGADADGVLWHLIDLDGWQDGATRRGTFSDRVGRDGGFETRTYASPRVLIARGWLRAPTNAARDAAIDKVVGLLADGSTGTLAVREGHLSRTSRVVLSDQTTTDRDGRQQAFWSLQLTASDPRRYSTAPSSVTFGLAAGSTSGLDFTAPGLDFSGAGLDFGPPGSIGQGTLTNTGTAPTEPVFTITGPLPPFMLRAAATGASIGYPAGLSAGETLVVDVGRRTARLSGTADRRPAPAQWSGFTVPPGGSLTVSLVGTAGGSGTGLVTATCSPAYW